jgi:hypothetical protein
VVAGGAGTDRERGDGPQVSVVIATYNWSSVLRFAIESVLWQSFQDFEVLVVGDSCTDDSAEVVASIGDERVHWHNLPANSGSQSAPNNAGLRLARGEYVAYLGHDDLWHPTHLAIAVDTSERTGADLVYALTVMIGPPGTDARVVAGVPPLGAPERPLFVPPSSVLHRRDLVEQIGPWRDHRTIGLPPDREFQERAWAYRQRFAGTGHLTVFKFPASWRPNSYRTQRSDEQADYARRMRTAPAFLNDELLAIARSYAARTTAVDLGAPEDVRPGWTVELNRWVRGLEAEVPPAGVEELFRLRAREQELLAQVSERTAWAQRLGQEVVKRDAIIRELQASLAEQTAWAQRSVQEVVERDRLIRELQAELHSKVGEAGRAIEHLRTELEAATRARRWH